MPRVSRMGTSAQKSKACASDPKRHCTATTAAGTPCRAWATHDSDPPRCSAHSESKAGRPCGSPPSGARAGDVSAGETSVSSTRGSAPPGSSTATPDLSGGSAGPHSALSGSSALPQLVADLKRRIDQLSAYIDDHIEDLEPADYARLGTLQGQLVSRLARLIRDQQAGSGSTALAAAINEALDLIGAEYGIQL